MSIINMQVCRQGADVAELIIYLAEPCHVCQIQLTISHGADDSTVPSYIDIRTGRNLEGLKLVVEVGILPLKHDSFLVLTSD